MERNKLPWMSEHYYNHCPLIDSSPWHSLKFICSCTKYLHCRLFFSSAADYFLGPYGSYASVAAAKAGLAAEEPAKSVRGLRIPVRYGLRFLEEAYVAIKAQRYPSRSLPLPNSIRTRHNRTQLTWLGRVC